MISKEALVDLIKRHNDPNDDTCIFNIQSTSGSNFFTGRVIGNINIVGEDLQFMEFDNTEEELYTIRTGLDNIDIVKYKIKPKMTNLIIKINNYIDELKEEKFIYNDETLNPLLKELKALSINADINATSSKFFNLKEMVSDIRRKRLDIIERLKTFEDIRNKFIREFGYKETYYVFQDLTKLLDDQGARVTTNTALTTKIDGIQQRYVTLNNLFDLSLTNVKVRDKIIKNLDLKVSIDEITEDRAETRRETFYKLTNSADVPEHPEGNRNLYALSKNSHIGLNDITSLVQNIATGEISFKVTGRDPFFGLQANKGEAVGTSRGVKIPVKTGQDIVVQLTNELFTKNFVSYFGDDDKAVKSFKGYQTNKFVIPKSELEGVSYVTLRFGINENMQEVGSIHSTKIKVEYGSTYTDWSPAPEDLGWSTNELAPTQSQRYLWKFDYIYYSDGSVKIAQPINLSIAGVDGNDVKDTKDPANGETVTKEPATGDPVTDTETSEPATGNETVETTTDTETSEPATGNETVETTTDTETSEPATGNE